MVTIVSGPPETLTKKLTYAPHNTSGAAVPGGHEGLRPVHGRRPPLIGGGLRGAFEFEGADLLRQPPIAGRRRSTCRLHIKLQKAERKPCGINKKETKKSREKKHSQKMQTFYKNGKQS